jgi:diacylglycerol kinase (ATP)
MRTVNCRTVMRKAALLYNPIAGPRGRDANRAARVQLAAGVLRDAGVEPLAVETHGPGTASAQAMEMIAAGCDTIIACGGDGTVHETLQQMVEQRADATLGVLPLGTGNALAKDLGVPPDPARAARRLLEFGPRRIAVGKLESMASPLRNARYFIAIAGVGSDAHLLYQIDLEAKRRLGMLFYYSEALKILLRHRLRPFVVEFHDGERVRSEVVSQFLAVRIRKFPQLMRNLVPGASLERDDLRIVLFKTPRALAFFSYVARRACGIDRMPRGIEVACAEEVVCRPLQANTTLTRPWRSEDRTLPVYAEVDGEMMGRIPVRLTAVPDALSLLMPRI